MSPRTGRRPGASGTRELIARAARRQFGERGYDRTSMRSVAAEAGVDPALVVHYFGTKQRLFTAVVDLAVDPARVIAAVAEGGLEDVGERLVRLVVGFMQDPDRAAAFTALIRCAASEPEAARLLRERVTRDVLTPLAHHLDMDRAELRGALAGSQIVGFVMGRFVVQVEPLTALSPDEIVRLVGPTLQRYLAGPL